MSSSVMLTLAELAAGTNSRGGEAPTGAAAPGSGLREAGRRSVPASGKKGSAVGSRCVRTDSRVDGVGRDDAGKKGAAVGSRAPEDDEKEDPLRLVFRSDEPQNQWLDTSEVPPCTSLGVC